jgi:hypothetical protein
MGFGAALLAFTSAAIAQGAAAPQRPQFENDYFRLRLAPRTPNQIAAFYEARGFPRFAIDELKSLCFITIGFRNKSDQVIWHDMDKWQITGPKGEIKRYPRSYWPAFWDKRGLAKRFQSTFRWTLMPEKLDFRPAEGEGGNMILPRTREPMTLHATFRLGGRRGTLVDVTIDNLHCAEDPK